MLLLAYYWVTRTHFNYIHINMHRKKGSRKWAPNLKSCDHECPNLGKMTVRLPISQTFSLSLFGTV